MNATQRRRLGVVDVVTAGGIDRVAKTSTVAMTPMRSPRCGHVTVAELGMTGLFSAIAGPSSVACPLIATLAIL
jgi:hypothetical protein